MRKVGDEYVRKCYNRFRERYFPDRELPEWKDIEFSFVKGSGPAEWGSVEFEDDGTVHALYLDEALRPWADTLKTVLLHEMIHMVVGLKAGHGKVFYAEALRALSNGAIKECF